MAAIKIRLDIRNAKIRRLLRLFVDAGFSVLLIALFIALKPDLSQVTKIFFIVRGVEQDFFSFHLSGVDNG